MATFKAEVQNKRADGTYIVKIRLTHNREVRRISTNIYATDADLTRSKKIKSANIIDKCDDLIKKCRKVCEGLGFALFDMPIDVLRKTIENSLQGKAGDTFYLDFIQYTRDKAAGMKKGTGDTYLNMVSALERFTKCKTLDILTINKNFLREFELFIANEPSQRGSNRKEAKKELPKKGGRAVSLYLACVRAIHNMAKDEYNDEDRGIIRIPYSPFKQYKVKPQPKTRKRALDVETIQQIINLPYKKEIASGAQNRFNLAKDCFLLSFALVGMNSADMYNVGVLQNDIIIYNRKKTESRREDDAEMRIRIEDCIRGLIDKYRDDKKLFRFYKLYSTPPTFNAALNKGLKQIGAELGIEDLEFYAARHSWATLARSKNVGIDKYTVHEALNHAPDNDMKVTDIYIERDWSVIWQANKDVLSLFDWSALLK